MLPLTPTVVGGEHCVFRSPVDRPLFVNVNFTWCNIFALGGAILMKLHTSGALVLLKRFSWSEIKGQCHRETVVKVQN